MSVDVLWESYRGLSPYHYSQNNPLVLQDQSGMADFYNKSGFIGSDGNEDGLRFAVFDNVKIEDYKTEEGDYDWFALSSRSFLFPSETVCKDIITEIADKIRPSNKLEDAGVIGKHEAQETFIKGEGKGHVTKNEFGEYSEASEMVKDAANKARERGMAITYYVHSHPSPSTNYSQMPTDPYDYNTAGSLGSNGILVTAHRIIFFTNKPKGPHSSIRAEDFLIRE